LLQALQGKDITIYGDGHQTRSFQYVDDLVEGLIKVCCSWRSAGAPRFLLMLKMASRVVMCSL
jgi:UDP-glucuronate decarboxylase